MSRLVDPTLCPDCRATLDASATCPSCGLILTGSLATDLWRLMVDADGIVEQLRALSGPAPVAASVPGPVAGQATGPLVGPAANSLPQFPRRAPAPVPTRRLPAASVPVVLLSLGALCLLVAAVVFVAVTWGRLGLTGRTLVLVGFTTLLALVAVALTHKNLRGAAETFWLVVAGMLTVDLLGAQSAGLAGLDALDWRGTGALVGLSLMAMGLGVGLWARGQSIGRLYGAEAVAVVGALVVCSTNAWVAEDPAVATTIAVPVLATLVAVLRGRVSVAAYGLGGLALTSWAVLLVLGWDRALEPVGLGAWWSDVRGWPLLAAAVLAAVVVYLPKIPEGARASAAGLGLFALVLLANGPQTPASETRDLVVASATLLVLALLAAFAPRAWALGAASLAALGVMGLGLVLAYDPWDVLSRLDPDGASAVGSALVASDDLAAAWTAVLVGAVIVGSSLLLLRRVPDQHLRTATRCVGAVAPAVLALAGLDLALALEPTLWGGTLAAVLATAVAAGAAWRVRDHVLAGWMGSVTTAYLAVIALYSAAANDLLIAMVTFSFFAVMAVVFLLRERGGSVLSAAVSAVVAALLGSGAVVAWGVELGAGVDARSVAVAVYAGLLAVLAAPATRRPLPRVTVESTALLLAGLTIVFSNDERTAAMALTVIGSAICLVSVVNRDRASLGWVGAVTLGIATVIRVHIHVQAPELYTLPAAVLLVAAGAWRMRQDPKANSFSVLGSGLTLALLPSLLLALDEPVSLRGALIGAAAVLVLATGVQQRVAAPFVLGAATVGILALRHLQPYADAVPRWISLGGIGLALLLVGVTWEARRQNLETAGRYLTALR